MKIYDFYRKKVYPNLYELYRCVDASRYRRFAFALSDDYLFSERFHPTRTMKITEGEFFYEYFNFCYMHNILTLMLYAVYHHAYPRVCINESNQDMIQWEWYFRQIPLPKDRMLPEMICSRRFASFQPGFRDIYEPEYIRMWSRLYKAFIHLNARTCAYVENEYRTVFKGKKRVLGVICRGTDYLRLRPAGHPVQPPTEDVISLCREKIGKDSYDAIYLATEEKQIRDQFCRAFPGMILENKRQYYDDIYYKENIQYIKDVHFDRENNNYLMGLEYLSSIILLSRCTSLIGGNCGGTMAALFFNDTRYEYTHIFDLGLYPYI